MVTGLTEVTPLGRLGPLAPIGSYIAYGWHLLMIASCLPCN